MRVLLACLCCAPLLGCTVSETRGFVTYDECATIANQQALADPARNWAYSRNYEILYRACREGRPAGPLY